MWLYLLTTSYTLLQREIQYYDRNSNDAAERLHRYNVTVEEAEEEMQWSAARGPRNKTEAAQMGYGASAGPLSFDIMEEERTLDGDDDWESDGDDAKDALVSQDY